MGFAGHFAGHRNSSVRSSSVLGISAGVGQLLYYSLEEAAEAYRVVAPGTVPMPRRSCKKADTAI